MDKVEIAIAGAGSRGYGYAKFVRDNPQRAQIVAVAEPRREYRERLLAEHDIPAANIFSDWRDMAARERLADAVVIATQDNMHIEPTLSFAANGYDILLEKPMAPDEDGCRRIAAAIEKNGVLFAVCHVLRYTAYTKTIRGLIDAGRIGEIVGVQQLEPVGFWHQTHSFVRGNWGNQANSSFMLLAKCCHDIDWINYIMGDRCTAVSSFGSLKHFRPEEAPAGAAARCVDCAVETNCPYSAPRIYGRFLDRGLQGWPLDVISEKTDRASVESALRDGPYGRCVYHCDNDVVDHQVVGMEYANGGTATLTMMAFTETSARKTRIFGTRGQISGDGSLLNIYDFLADESEEIDTRASEQSVAGGHGGGDDGLMDSFISAVADRDQSLILSGPEETLQSHLAVFAAEHARQQGCVERLG